MNKRIQELAEQAKDYARKHVEECRHYNHYMEHNEYELRFEEKFAELIVRECMTTVLKESKWYWDKDEWESSNAIQNAARRLKEHFGV